MRDRMLGCLWLEVLCVMGVRYIFVHTCIYMLFLSFLRSYVMKKLSDLPTEIDFQRPFIPGALGSKLVLEELSLLGQRGPNVSVSKPCRFNFYHIGVVGINLHHVSSNGICQKDE